MEEPEPGADSRQGIGSVETAARVIFALESAGGPLTLNQLAQRCGEQPSKIHRYLVSLGRVGLTSQSSSTSKYDLGPASRRLGTEALRRTNDIGIISDHAILLAERVGHSVNLSVWGDNGPVIVRWDYGNHALSLTARVGATLPLIESAAGQIFLANLPSAMTQHALHKSLEVSPEVSAKSVEALIASVRESGFGQSDGRVISDHFSIATAIHTASDALPIALTIVIPRGEATTEQIERARRALQETVAAIELDLGTAGSGLPPAV